MGEFEASLMVGFLFGLLSVCLVNLVNERYARQEEKFSLLLLKRAKRD
jgi:hypothetical protein